MRRYTNKELKSMTPEEGENLVKECLVEFEQLGQQLRDVLAKDTDSRSEKKENTK